MYISSAITLYNQIVDFVSLVFTYEYPSLLSQYIYFSLYNFFSLIPLLFQSKKENLEFDSILMLQQKTIIFYDSLFKLLLIYTQKMGKKQAKTQSLN